MTGRLGKLPGVSVKSALSKPRSKEHMTKEPGQVTGPQKSTRSVTHKTKVVKCL